MAKDSRVEAVISHWSPRAAIHEELGNQALADGYQTADWMATQLGGQSASPFTDSGEQPDGP